MASVLVLGGTSWVGGQIAHEAIVRGHDVTCLARGESGLAPEPARFVRADRSQPDAYADVMDQRWDQVVDIARHPGHVRGAVAALGGVAGHWTFVSSGSVYAARSGTLTEDSPLLPALDADEVTLESYGEGKVACEQALQAVPHHLVVRPGLIGGPGDRSDRLGYYVSRFALAGAGPVLVPDVPEQPAQVIDVRDLARWVVRSGEAGTTGIVHAPGEPSTVGTMIDLSAEIAGFTGERVAVTPDRLRGEGVDYWAGERSLPLWLPEGRQGIGMMDDTRALARGLERRPFVETLRDTLDDERQRGLDRPRRAGLSRADELALIAAAGCS